MSWWVIFIIVWACAVSALCLFFLAVWFLATQAEREVKEEEKEIEGA